MQYRFLPLAGAALAALLSLSACQRSATNDRVVVDHGGAQSLTFLNGDLTLKADGQPPATITRDGKLLIDGKPVALDAEQQRLLLAYRSQIEAVGMQGVEVGKAGAALGVKAAGDAISGVLSGDTEHIGERVEAQADKIKQAALKICDQVAALRAAQDALMEKVPAFRPYSTLEDSDVRDCKNSAA
ncbi:hypothetical protein ACP93_20555 [Xanthomonas sp. NCPPB 1128]|uniref:DUF2884 family protein n=1 Tax=Xanthomonas sp. NCPPB 1128 TaxID=1775876 RepID=UPI00065AC944|nr:DUF2884 family protein [Xanthomonas sp. NCPPB 1128]KMM73662.1 hypothetical protein ACP93_20555 [Xanthomonas sp. NCPPB 1128]